MSGFDLSPNIWVDPLVIVTMLVTAYVPVRDVALRRSRKAKERAERERAREYKLDQLLQDWHGTPERPGFPEIPGIPTRIYQIEHEIHFNSGTSVKDAVHRTDTAVKALGEDVKEIKEKLEENSAG